MFPVDINISDKSFYDIGLLYDEDVADNIKFKFEYRVALYGKEPVSRIISSFRELLTNYINNKKNTCIRLFHSRRRRIPQDCL